MSPGDFLSPILWTLPVTLPLLLVLLLALRSLRALAESLAPLAALPAFLLAVFAETGTVVELPLLLGMRFGFTETTQLFLLFSAGLWLFAGLYARAYMVGEAASSRFFGFFLATMGGNLGLALARDVVGFYLFFILMSFAAYGLIVHDGTPQAFRAGRVYLVLAVVGEAFLLPGMILVSVVTGTYRLEEVPTAVAESPLRGLSFFLILAGFGTKVSILPLHFSLPLIYPASPPPAAAALSGPVIKAGLLGWLLLLPAGETAAPFWGALVVVAGLAAAFYGVVIGLMQDNAATVLAYSSISQLGWITVGLGVGLLVPEAWPFILTVVLVYAAHHALAKSSLFLGLGVAGRSTSVQTRRLAFTGLLLAALVLAGAPLTSGAVAKYLLKEATETAPGAWSVALKVLLQAGAVGTALLMGRFLFVVRPGFAPGKLSAGLWLPWAAQLALTTIGILALPEGPLETVGLTLSFSTLWPLVVGALLVGGFWWLRRKTELGSVPRIPEGDLLVPLVRLLGLSRRVWETGRGIAVRGPHPLPAGARTKNEKGSREASLIWLEVGLRYWTIAGLAFLALVLIIIYAGLAS